MNALINKLERKIGKYAIHNLSLYIICTYAIGYVLLLTGTLDIFTLNPYQVISKFQIWRIFTWVFVPPESFSIFVIIMLFLYYSLGKTLEMQWGAFRFNLYIFSGMFFTCLGAFLLYIFTVYFAGWNPEIAGYSISSAFSTYYINMSIFLAFATMFPNVQLMLYFIIPIKIKWLAYVEVALVTWDFIVCNSSAARFAIIMSLLNFILFFFSSRNYRRLSPKEIHRRREFQRAVKRQSASKNSTFDGFGQGKEEKAVSFARHKCSICGRTENDDASLEFRYCSKCNGEYEYCSDHLFTHEHKK